MVSPAEERIAELKRLIFLPKIRKELEEIKETLEAIDHFLLSEEMDLWLDRV